MILFPNDSVEPRKMIALPLETAQKIIDKLHDLEERNKALEKENTLLSLYGREVKRVGQGEPVEARAFVGET